MLWQLAEAIDVDVASDTVHHPATAVCNHYNKSRWNFMCCFCDKSFTNAINALTSCPHSDTRFQIKKSWERNACNTICKKKLTTDASLSSFWKKLSSKIISKEADFIITNFKGKAMYKDHNLLRKRNCNNVQLENNKFFQ